MEPVEGVVEIAYGEGWDLAGRTLWRPLTAESAAARDGAGLPYVAVCRRPGRNAPLEVRLTSWRDHFVGVWVYDEEGRRTRRLDLRLLDGDRLLRYQTEDWAYADATTPEFDRGCERWKLTLRPDGRGREERERPGRGIFVTSADVPVEQRWLDRPVFGSWPLFSGESHGIAGEPRMSTADPEPEPDGEAAPKEPWLPPRPARAGRLDELFRPGTRLATAHRPEMTVLAPVERGTLRVPSGLLAIDGPDNFDQGPELVVPVPPGEYVLQEAQASYGYDCEWRGTWVTTTASPAVRVKVGEAPVATWEMVLGPENDVRLLDDGHAYGFGTDGASGCFADAGSWTVLKGLFARALVQGDEKAGETIEDSAFFLRTSEPDAADGAGADLVAFYTTGDGVWPVWAGRSAAGEVVAVVVVGNDDFAHGVRVLEEPSS
ncbi:DUF4241 domain-containing protein [Streptomyces sp. NPDC056069]|uniref:DUF4241 domain-containing protein n=1 Tax=Streptomyces sp. NPDC056069 TaxID=3345702 RepID=UPI0035DA1222